MAKPDKTVAKKPRKQSDPVPAALSKTIGSLGKLSEDDRKRVLRAVFAFYGMSEAEVKADPAPAAEATE